VFDSHCHLDAGEYDEDRGAVLVRARAAGLVGIVVPGYTQAQWTTLATFCAQDAILRYGLGLHPWYVHELSESALAAALEELPALVRVSSCIAVGECGLDASHARRGGASIAVQQRVLDVHLSIARAAQLPIILHCVAAHGLMLDVLEARGPLASGGVLHSYSGSAELVSRYEKLGLYFSFAGIVTRPEAKRPQRALCAVPRNRLLVESDGPDQAVREIADGASGRRSEPAHIRHVLAAGAALRNEPYEQLVRDTTNNGLRLFGNV